MTTITKPEIGSISHGTLRACDLADAYLGACDIYGVTLPADALQLLQDAACHASSTVAPEFSKATWEALSEAESALGGIAPFGCYFGAHVGDGSDIGFWLSDEWADALAERCIDESDYETVLSICEAEGIAPESLCDAYQGEFESHSEETAGADYAEQLADECGMIPRDVKWPFTCLNWEQAWTELSCDGFSLHQLSAGRWAVIRAV